MKVVYARRAENDLAVIDAYTMETWGPAQRQRYMAMLRECCEKTLPAVEHAQEVEGRPGLYRYRCGSHCVYYRKRAGGLRITRVLHAMMLPEKHL